MRADGKEKYDGVAVIAKMNAQVAACADGPSAGKFAFEFVEAEGASLRFSMNREIVLRTFCCFLGGNFKKLLSKAFE